MDEIYAEKTWMAGNAMPRAGQNTLPPQQGAMRWSQAIDQIALALATAQAELKPAAFDSTNPHFKSRYASLAAVLDAVRGVAAKNQLAYLFSPPRTHDRQMVKAIDKDGKEYDEYWCLVTTACRVLHSSGQFVEGECTLPALDTSHGIGGASTYGKRYCLSALFAVAADEDDDGNSARGLRAPEQAPAKRREPPKPEPRPEPRPEDRAQSRAPAVPIGQREEPGSMEDQLRRSIDNAISDEQIKANVQAAAKALQLNPMQFQELCLELYKKPTNELTRPERLDFMRKLQVKAAGAT